MERVANKLVERLVHNKVIEKEDKDIYVYAICCLMMDIAPVIIVILFGIILDNVKQSIIFILPFVLIRKYSGGYHTKKASTCVICSCTVLFISLRLLSYANNIWLSNILIILSVTTIVYLTPIESENHKLSKYEKKRCKKCTYVIISLFVFFYVIFLLWNKYKNAYALSFGFSIVALMQIMCIPKLLKNRR